MANAGKTIVKIKAPVMMVQTQKKIKGIEFLNEHVKIFFKDKDHAMKFRLVYEGKN